MADVTQVDIVNGVPTTGTGTVKTLNPIYDAIIGTIAHDDADSGNGSKISAKAKSALSGLTLVSANDRTDLFADLDGVLVIRADAALGDLVNATASDTAGSSTACITAAGSGVKVYLTDIIIANSSSNDITVAIKDGSSTKMTVPVPAKGGFTRTFKSPIAGTANTAWNFQASSASTTVYCTLSGFKSKV